MVPLLFPVEVVPQILLIEIPTSSLEDELVWQSFKDGQSVRLGSPSKIPIVCQRCVAEEEN